MYTRRRFPHRLIALAALAAWVSACASDRYVGSIGRDGAYVNRGYGFTVLVAKLDGRWAVPDQGSSFDSPIDVDGDGQLEIDETRRIRRPALTLESTTSSASIAVDVLILGKNNREVPLEGIARMELAKLTDTSSVTFSPVAVGAFPGVVADARSLRFAAIDVEDFLAEEHQTRRQIYTVVLRAQEIGAEQKQDFDLLLSGLVVNRRGGAETAQEKW